MRLKLHPPLGSEIDLLDAPGLGLCPGTHPHPLDQAEIKDLCVVREAVCLVGVRVEGLVPRSTVHHQMMLGEPERGWSDADCAVDRATRRFGSSAVRPASLVGVRARGA